MASAMPAVVKAVSTLTARRPPKHLLDQPLLAGPVTRLGMAMASVMKDVAAPTMTAPDCRQQPKHLPQAMLLLAGPALVLGTEMDPATLDVVVPILTALSQPIL